MLDDVLITQLVLIIVFYVDVVNTESESVAVVFEAFKMIKTLKIYKY